jgi:hypothetical protein
MSFGKKSSSPLQMHNISRQESKSTQKHKIISLLFIVAICAAAITYIYRVSVASIIYPPLLDSFVAGDRQIQNTWRRDATGPSEAREIIDWTLLRMAEICHDQSAVAQIRSRIAFMDAMDLNSENIESRQSLYGDNSLTAFEVVQLTVKDKLNFCPRMYFIAQYDGRVAAIEYSKKSQQNIQARIQKNEYISSLMRSIIGKRSRNLTTQEALLNDCFNLTPDDAKEMTECFWRIKEQWDSVKKTDAQKAAEHLKGVVARH